MKTTLRNISVSIVAGGLLTLVSGCRGDEPFKNIVVGQQPEMFNLVCPIGRSAGSTEVMQQAGYSMTFDTDNRTANISVTNLCLYPGDTPRTLIFDNVPMTYTADKHETERIVTADVLTSLSPDGEAVTITDATFIYTESNALDPNGTVGIYARFTIFNQYVVTAYPYEMLADGTTRITDSAGRDVIDYTPVYKIYLDPLSMRAEVIVDGLTVNGESLAPAIRNLVLEFSDDGYTLAGEAATSVSVDDGYVIKSFNATAKLRDELKIEFDMLVPDGDNVHVSAFLTPNLFR